jgi:hypothetical protein
MSDPDFPDELRSFIQDTIPTVDAAELLLVLALHSERTYQVAELIDAMRPTAVSEPVVRRYLGHFQSQGLVAAKDGNAYQYSPETPELGAMVRALTKVFNERPVTLVRMIYAPKDEKIRSFADAFRLKKP